MKWVIYVNRGISRVGTDKAALEGEQTLFTPYVAADSMVEPSTDGSLDGSILHRSAENPTL